MILTLIDFISLIIREQHNCEEVDLKRSLTTFNIIFKLKLHWSLGLWDEFRRGVFSRQPGGDEYKNVIQKGRKL